MKMYPQTSSLSFTSVVTSHEAVLNENQHDKNLSFKIYNFNPKSARKVRQQNLHHMQSHSEIL